ncbi:MAG: LemA family protein [Erysipelotrichaceae bacterium]|nr:LemA family protein [Erysipelotrichaceae bacterium]
MKLYADLLEVLVPVIIVVVVVLVLVGLVAWVISIYNKLVKARNRVENSWAQIDVQLKRRFDLIPNLVETVKGYTKHEADIFGEFAKARQMYDTAKDANSVKAMAEADANLNKALNIAVNAVQERYPELKANANYQQLMDELKDCENKISYNRQFYNDTVLNYTNLKQLFPSNIIASMFKFEDKEYFKVDEVEQREAPKVSF